MRLNPLSWRQSAFPLYFLLRFAFIFPICFFLFISTARSQSSTTTVVDYTATFPAYICNAFAATPNISTSTPKNGTLQHISVLGQPVQTTASSTKCLEVDCIQQTTFDQYGDPSINEYGTEYLIKYPFKQGYYYTFTLTLEAGTGAATTGLPTVYLGLTNTPSSGQDCKGPEAPINVQGDNPLVTGNVAVLGYNPLPAMNTSSTVTFNTLTVPYSYLMISDILPGSGNDGTCQVYIKNITIVETLSASPPPRCILATPSGLTTTNNTQTLSWSSDNGAASYNLTIKDTHNGVTTTTNTATATTSYNFCALGAGDNVSYTVTAVCTGGNTSETSTACSFVATAPLPQNLAYNTTSNLLSWTAVPGATGYVVQLTDLTANTTPVTYSASRITVSANDLNLISDHQYQASVSATTCYSAVYSSPITFTVPCLTSVINTTEQTGNYSPVWVYYEQVNTAVSYSIRFTNTATEAVTTQSNLPYYSSGYQFSITPGTYQVAIQTVNALCTSPWETYALTVTVVASPPPSCTPPPSFAAVEAAGTSIKVYWVNTSGATSYNFKFVNLTTGGTTVVSNIPYSSGGYTYNGIAGDVYQVYIESNCSIGNSGWIAYSSTVTAAISRNLVSGDSTTILSQNNAISDLNKFMIFPVPSSGELNLIHNASETGSGDISVISAVGSIMLVKHVGIVAGQNTFTLDVSHFPNGMYIVKLFNGKTVFIQKLVVQK